MLFTPPNLLILLGGSGFEFHARKNNVRDKDERVWLYLWLYVAKYRDPFQAFRRVLCARKTCVSYWLIVSCEKMDVEPYVTLNQ